MEAMQDDSAILVAIGKMTVKLDILISDAEDMKTRVTELERAADMESGRRQGIALMVTLAKSLPIGVVAFVLGKGI